MHKSRKSTCSGGIACLPPGLGSQAAVMPPRSFFLGSEDLSSMSHTCRTSVSPWNDLPRPNCHTGTPYLSFHMHILVKYHLCVCDLLSCEQRCAVELSDAFFSTKLHVFKMAYPTLTIALLGLRICSIFSSGYPRDGQSDHLPQKQCCPEHL